MNGSDAVAGRVGAAESYRDQDARRSTAPVIGLTTALEQIQTGVWNVPASYVPKMYLQAVNRAGGIAVLLPPQPADSAIANRVLDGLDGLIVTGGKDVDPGRYGQKAHPETDAPRTDRDEWEDALLRAAIARELPFLGICRGLQMLNVALGGTLHQHLPDVVGSTRFSSGYGEYSHNEVAVQAGTKTGQLLDGSPALSVHSYHHQAVDELGQGLSVTARSDDGTVQAVELAGMPFGVAVQWHPEVNPDDLRLFAGLVDAAREYRSDAGNDDGLAR